ncbi:hypothetical protein K449DRAFT_239959 [Hypoxylon sp. EC38]|nr:hypothetical protein K449DRAFT_239959 [Hypoxylon sp. EC38]
MKANQPNDYEMIPITMYNFLTTISGLAPYLSSSVLIVEEKRKGTNLTLQPLAAFDKIHMCL